MDKMHLSRDSASHITYRSKSTDVAEHTRATRRDVARHDSLGVVVSDVSERRDSPVVLGLSLGWFLCDPSDVWPTNRYHLYLHWSKSTTNVLMKHHERLHVWFAQPPDNTGNH